MEKKLIIQFGNKRIVAEIYVIMAPKYRRRCSYTWKTMVVLCKTSV